MPRAEARTEVCPYERGLGARGDQLIVVLPDRRRWDAGSAIRRGVCEYRPGDASIKTMTPRLPREIRREHLLAALREIDAGEVHPFGRSTGYDVLFGGRRYPPKAVVGIAARHFDGRELGPADFWGGLGTPCFRILANAGFDIVAKGDVDVHAEEESGSFLEGSPRKVMTIRYERDTRSRRQCIDAHGARCCVCEMEFSRRYGALGDGYMHVHHLTPLSALSSEHEVDPVRDLRPVCPNCHAMLHRRRPPFAIDELRALLLESLADGGVGEITV